MSNTTENNYVSDGTTVLYSFTFPYINVADVRVSLNQLEITAFTLSNATTVELDEAPAGGVSIRIYRDTPTDAIAAQFFPGSAIRAQDLNNNFEQTLYVVQESQTIIENSDAASVIGIANEALSTANQASATANAISGTANEALTSATAAETVANKAASDATEAQATAIAARTVADAALNPGSVIGDLSNVSSEVASVNQVLVWTGSQWSPDNQVNDVGGNASAWANVGSDATILSSFNIASVTRNEQGRYAVTFINPMANTNYLAGVTIQAAANGFAFPANKTTTGFLAVINGTNLIGADLDFGFTIYTP